MVGPTGQGFTQHYEEQLARWAEGLEIIGNPGTQGVALGWENRRAFCPIYDDDK